MRKTLALVGLLFIGLTLVLSPALGLLSSETTDASLLAIDAVTSSVIEAAPDDPATTTTESSQPGDDPTTTSAAPTTSIAEAITIAGPSVSTRFGPFQVEISMENGALVDITTLAQPGDSKSRRINAMALPAYEAAAIDAQSADIDVISGATYTWQAYTTSLQAALDQAALDQAGL